MAFIDEMRSAGHAAEWTRGLLTEGLAFMVRMLSANQPVHF